MPHQPDSHHDHDLALVAALAAGDAEGRDHTRATELVTSCAECALVRDDLVALAASLRTLPPPRRTRDYRLTADQAAALRPTGWRRFLGAFGGTGFRFATPVGTAMATLGIAGLLLSAVPSALPAGTTGDGTSGAAVQAAASDADSRPSAAPSLGYGLTGGSVDPDASASVAAYAPAATEISKASASAAAPSAAPSVAASAEALASAVPTAPAASLEANVAPTAAPDQVPPTRVSSSPTALVFTSLLLLVAGAMLVLLRAASRRATPV
jgi:hypothetical protein